MPGYVDIKGVDDGIAIHFDEAAPYDKLIEELKKTLDKNKNFFSGSLSKVIISGRTLLPLEKSDIKQIFSKEYGMKKVSFEEDLSKLRKIEEKGLTKTTVAKAEEKKEPVPDVELVSSQYFDAKSIFIANTVRSGQRIECEGDIVVIGDVNPGAEIIAGGSIAVFGTLRGLAHAGAKGREDVCVAALYMRPKQLRVSGRIIILEENEDSAVGEIAELKNDKVVIRAIGSR